MGGAGLYEVVLNERADGLCNEAADFIEQSLTPPDSEGVVEAAYREAWHEGYATGDAGGAYSAVENDWLGSDARAALQSSVSPQAGMREALEEGKRLLGISIGSSTGTRATIHLTRAKQLLAKIDAALSTAPIPMSEDAK
jgi:hypothetical protein